MCRYILDYQTKIHPETVIKAKGDALASRSFSREGLTIDDLVGSSQQIRVTYGGAEVFRYEFEKPRRARGHSRGYSEGHWQGKVKLMYAVLVMHAPEIKNDVCHHGDARCRY